MSHVKFKLQYVKIDTLETEKMSANVQTFKLQYVKIDTIV